MIVIVEKSTARALFCSSEALTFCGLVVFLLDGNLQASLQAAPLAAVDLTIIGSVLTRARRPDEQPSV